MQEHTDLVAALAAIRTVAPRFHTATDDELVADLDLVEQAGRVVDALRHRAAAEVDHRSRAILGGDSLAFRSNARDGVELVQRLARVDRQTARRRVGLGAAIAPTVGLDGSLLPGRYPAIREAFESGQIGAESARLIVDVVKAIRRRVTPEQVEAVVDELLVSARSTDTEVLHEIAVHWVDAIDPDGAEPRHEQQHRKRSLVVGRTGLDGMTRMSLLVTPEHLAVFKEVLASRRRGGVVLVEAGADETDEDLGPEWRTDDRTRKQADYDAVAGVVEAGVRAEHAGTTAATAAVTHEVVVRITAAELEARRGQGWTAGVLAGLPVPVVECRMCSGGARLEVLGDGGEPLHLSRAHRLFSPAQKKALLVAANGRCQYPGCRTPAPYLQAHHVDWVHRDHGATSVANGVMLCSYHHHLIHAKRSQIEIRRFKGAFHFVPVGWAGDPAPRHRAGSGPGRTGPPTGRGDDPWRR